MRNRYYADGDAGYYPGMAPPARYPMDEVPDGEPEDGEEESFDPQEDENNQRMLSGQPPIGDASPYDGGDYALPFGITASQMASMGDQLPAEDVRPIPAPAVQQKPSWMDRIGFGNHDTFEHPTFVGGTAPEPTYTDRLHRLEQAYETMPVRKAPNLLERIAAGAMGAAAGYSNAARRAAPINIPQVTQGILYPGYDAKLAQWQSRVAPLEKAAEIAGQIQATGYKGQQVAAETALKHAQLQMNEARARYYDNLAGQQRNRFKVDSKTGNVYDSWTGKVVSSTPKTMKDLYDQAMALPGMDANNPADREKALDFALNGGKLPPARAAKAPSFATGALAVRASGGMTGIPEIDKLTPQQAKQSVDYAKERDQSAEALGWANLNERREERAATLHENQQQHLDAILQRKHDNERRALDSYQRALGSINSNGADATTRAQRLQEAQRNYVGALQSAQDEYESQWQAHGQQTGPHQVVTMDQNGVMHYATPKPPERVGPPTPSPTFSVNLPNGNVAHFPTQQQADAFKRANRLP